jgi:hypothetical protein
MKDTVPIHTDVYGLRFFIKGKRICFIVHTPQGKETRHWADLPPKTLAAVMKEINAHLEEEARVAAMTPQERAEMYQEMMGS